MTNQDITQWRYDNMPFKSATSFDDLFENARPFQIDNTSKRRDEWIGSYCIVRDPHQGLDVSVKPAVAADISANMLHVDYDQIHFEIIKHNNGKALVLASYGLIIGSRYLAYIDASTIPQTERMVS